MWQVRYRRDVLFERRFTSSLVLARSVTFFIGNDFDFHPQFLEFVHIKPGIGEISDFFSMQCGSFFSSCSSDNNDGSSDDQQCYECSSDMGSSDSSAMDFYECSSGMGGSDGEDCSFDNQRRKTSRTPSLVRGARCPPTPISPPGVSRREHAQEWMKWVLSTTRYKDALHADCGCKQYEKGKLHSFTFMRSLTFFVFSVSFSLRLRQCSHESD